MDTKRDWVPTYIISIALIIVVAAFTVLYMQASSRITNNDSTVSDLKDQLTSQQSQLASANTQLASIGGQITTLTSNVASDSSQITSLGNQLSSADSQIAAFTKQLNDADSEISALQGQNSSSSSQLATLQGQLSSLQDTLNSVQSQLTSTQGTVNSLQSQINSEESTLNGITQEINTPVTLFSSRSITQGPNAATLIYSFSPAYSGYVSISGISSSDTGYLLIVNEDADTSATFAFGRGTTVYIPLEGGPDYSIYFGNHDLSGTITASLSGTYQL
jgi:septal ring factor EnvC (AmiA/AmiB activator)